MATQRIAGLTWEFCLPEANEEVLDGLERQFGVTFPPLFREVMRRCHGAGPIERDSFAYQDPDIGECRSCLGALLRLNDPNDINSLWATVDMLAADNQLPSGLVPFATDGGGDFICLDYRVPRDEPRIAYWMHEHPTGDDAAVVIAETFGEFLESLEPPDEVPDSK